MEASIEKAYYHLHDAHWLRTSAGVPRGYVHAQRLHELWFHTGTACNLACSFCLEGSHPGDQRLQQMHFEDALPLLEEARTLGVEQLSFTGGEPFINRDIFRILGRALEQAPCLVLSNGTKPLARRFSDLLVLRDKPHPLRIRISLDAPDAAAHDAERGQGAFQSACQSLFKLHQHGFGVSVARQMAAGEDMPTVDAAYRRLFARIGIPEDTRIVAFPDFLPPGAHPGGAPEITENCMTTYQTADSRAQFMCAYSRMAVKVGGRVRIYACTLVDDDPDYDLGDTLAQSLRPRVMLRHHRCFSCFSCGASCSEG